MHTGYHEKAAVNKTKWDLFMSMDSEHRLGWSQSLPKCVLLCPGKPHPLG